MIEVEREKNDLQQVDADKMRVGDRGELVLLKNIKDAAPREVAAFAAGHWTSAKEVA